MILVSQRNRYSEEKRREREEKQRTIKLQKYPMSTLEKKRLVDLK